MLGNGIVGILAESSNMWERRVPLCPSHCARLLHSGKGKSGVDRIIVQPSTKRIYHDDLYEDVGCEVSEDLSECGLILGVKQPKLELILPDRAYAFFSHTHKAQRENMPLLDKVLAERVSLFDYELIVGDNGKRMIAFGKYAGRAGLIDFLRGLGERYLSLGYSTPFLSLGASYMYSSLAAAKAAVISVGEKIATMGLPSGISPVVFVFTGTGNVSQGAQEIFSLLPHSFVDPSKLPELFKANGDTGHPSRTPRRAFQVYGCVVTSRDMVSPKDPSKNFDKVDYYTHPEHYEPVFHERIAPYASVIGSPSTENYHSFLRCIPISVIWFCHASCYLNRQSSFYEGVFGTITVQINCMYWEKRFPRLLSTEQLQELKRNGSRLIGICDITCDIGGSIEFINQSTSLEKPFFRYNPFTDSYHYDMEDDGIICLAVDILPTEFAKEASQHFGDILYQFIHSLASTKNLLELPPYLRRACITHGGALTSLYDYIPRMRNSDSVEPSPSRSLNRKKYTTLVSLSGHLFDQLLINDALDIIEAAGGSFRLVRCEVGQNTTAMSYSELEVGADDSATLDRIMDSLTTIAHPRDKGWKFDEHTKSFCLNVGRVSECNMENRDATKGKSTVLILGAGRVCRPAVEFLASVGNNTSPDLLKTYVGDVEETKHIKVIVASLYLKDAEMTIEGIPDVEAIQLDVMDHGSLCNYVAQVDVVISLLPPSCHTQIANVCIELRKHLVTASYVSDTMSKLDQEANCAGVTILCEMGLDPGIDHMMAMKMINHAHIRRGKIKSFTSYCGGLPSPAAANNPLAYKFSWNPAGAIRAGQNPAIYKSHGEIVNVDGNKLFDAAVKFRLPDLPAFALECLPNRNSLVYGDLYGISGEASTIFRGTLRYEGFSEIMGNLANIGLFNAEVHPMLKDVNRPTFGSFLDELLEIKTTENGGTQRSIRDEKEMASRLIKLGHCKEMTSAVKTAKTIRYLGLHENDEIPTTCLSAFDVVCLQMEERLAYASSEQDMVLLHHEVEVEFPDGRPVENHRATLLEFGRTKNNIMTTAMALTVGIPAAIGALLLLGDKIKKRGVVRPLDPEVYLPALDVLEAYGFKIIEKMEGI